MNLTVIGLVIAQTLSLFMSGLLLVWSTLHTVQSHANIFCNVHGAITILAALLTCRPVSKNQLIATFVIILAAILMVSDPYAVRIGEKPNLFADMVAVISAMFFALYFYFNELLKKYQSVGKIVLY